MRLKPCLKKVKSLSDSSLTLPFNLITLISRQDQSILLDKDKAGTIPTSFTAMTSGKKHLTDSFGNKAQKSEDSFQFYQKRYREEYENKLFK